MGAPTPTPPVPSPSPSPFAKCPSDADHIVAEDGRDECLWSSGAHGLTIPSSAKEYCGYVADGYFGYSWELQKTTLIALNLRQKAAMVWTHSVHGLMERRGLSLTKVLRQIVCTSPRAALV